VQTPGLNRPVKLDALGNGTIRALLDGLQPAVADDAAQVALAPGIFNSVLLAGGLDVAVDALAASLAGGPRRAVNCMKRKLAAVGEGSWLPALPDLDAARVVRCVHGSGPRQAGRAFLEKRAPRRVGL